MTAWSLPAPGRLEVAPGVVLADTASRFAAYGLDALVLFLVNTAIAVALGPSIAIGDQAVASPRDVAFGVASVVIDAAYFIGSWSGGRRATPAQRLFKLEVGNAFDGRSLSIAQAIRRWLGLGYWVSLFMLVTVASVASSLALGAWFIVLLTTTANSPTKQGLHDRFANTVVVRQAGGPSGWTLVILVVGVWVAAIWAWANA
jgi:uncharacterized RDD family membrane protein YckC